MMPPFRYPDEDWRAVEACLTKLVPHADACALLRQQLRQHIEATVDAYLRRMAHFDPRSPEQIAVKACWAKIAKHAHALHAAVDKLEAIDPWPAMTLRLAIAFAESRESNDAACRLSGLEEPERGGGTLGGKGGEGF